MKLRLFRVPEVTNYLADGRTVAIGSHNTPHIDHRFNVVHPMNMKGSQPHAALDVFNGRVMMVVILAIRLRYLVFDHCLGNLNVIMKGTPRGQRVYRSTRPSGHRSSRRCVAYGRFFIGATLHLNGRRRLLSTSMIDGPSRGGGNHSPGRPSRPIPVRGFLLLGR